jgi:hypothetical protein
VQWHRAPLAGASMLQGRRQLTWQPCLTPSFLRSLRLGNNT